MTLTMRRGFFRLALLGFAIFLAVSLAMLYDALRQNSVEEAARNVRLGVLLSAGYWAFYGAVLWVVAGFGLTPPVSTRHVWRLAIAVSGLVLISSAVIWWESDRRARVQAEVHAQEQREHQAMLERLSRERINVPNSGARARSSSDERRTMVADRTAEILAVYPEGAEDLKRDLALQGIPRGFGSEDESRRDPETAAEYLRQCASLWIRRKCAEQIARREVEEERSFFDVSEAQAQIEREREAALEAERRRNAAARAAKQRARAVRERVHREAEAILRTEEERRRLSAPLDDPDRRGEERNEIEMTELEETIVLDLEALLALYRGAGSMQHWCAENHGRRFGRENPIQAEMQADCRRQRSSLEAGR